MTTTVYDRESKVIAADTRWSVKLHCSDGKEYLAFTDDSVFEKIADRPKTTMVMAGNGQLIALWKQWWYESLDTSAMPPFEINGETAIVLLIINKESNVWVFDIGDKIASVCSDTGQVNAVFSGSGSVLAANCWSDNRCAKTAIRTASGADVHTGDKVRYVDFGNNQSNIESKSYEYMDIVSALTQGGYMMEFQENSIVPLKEHPLSEEVAKKLASGDAVACAPTPDLRKYVWDDARKQKLKSAIEEVRSIEGID